MTTADEPASNVGFTSGSHQIALLSGRFEDGALELLDCDVCGDLDSLVELAKTRVTRELMDTEKSTYLSGE